MAGVRLDEAQPVGLKPDPQELRNGGSTIGRSAIRPAEARPTGVAQRQSGADRLRRPAHCHASVTSGADARRDPAMRASEMPAIELFLIFAALVVAIGLIVRRYDIKSGRVTDTAPEDPALPMRERFADTGFLSSSDWKARYARRKGASPGVGKRAAGSPDAGAGDGGG